MRRDEWWDTPNPRLGLAVALLGSLLAWVGIVAAVALFF